MNWNNGSNKMLYVYIDACRTYHARKSVVCSCYNALGPIHVKLPQIYPFNSKLAEYWIIHNLLISSSTLFCYLYVNLAKWTENEKNIRLNIPFSKKKMQSKTTETQNMTVNKYKIHELLKFSFSQTKTNKIIKKIK